jgi:dihydrofolate synthase/folylpolyglutamate synthase
LDYKEIENWILNRLPFYQNSGSVAYKPGLDNINKFIKELNLSNNQLKFIHVGGTNGKGEYLLIYIINSSRI